MCCAAEQLDIQLESNAGVGEIWLVRWHGIDKATFAASWVPKLLRAGRNTICIYNKISLARLSLDISVIAFVRRE